MYTVKFGDYTLTAKVSNYLYDPLCLAVELVYDEGIYCTVTVNLGIDIGNNAIIPQYTAFVDTNNLDPNLVQLLVQDGLMTPYVRFGVPVTKESGYCMYPLYSFNVQKLRDSDPEGCKEYEQVYKEAFNTLNR